jgi:hypothetical protein
MATLDQVVDHAADLQRSVDQLWDEMLVCQIAVLSLAVLVIIMAWQLRREAT